MSCSSTAPRLQGWGNVPAPVPRFRALDTDTYPACTPAAHMAKSVCHAGNMREKHALVWSHAHNTDSTDNTDNADNADNADAARGEAADTQASNE